MSTPVSTPSHGATERILATPYAFPQTGSASVDRVLHASPAKVGPYVPEPWRGKPAGERLVTPLFVAPIATAEMPVAEMPPSYPTPAYFTPLASPAQDDFSTPAFEIPAIIDATAGLSAMSFVEPSELAAPEAPSLPWIESFLSSTPAMPMRAVDEPPAALTPASYTPPVAEAIVEEAVSTAWSVTEAAPEAPTPSDAWALDEAAEQMRALADELRDHEGFVSDGGEAARLFDASPTPEPLPAWSDDDMIDIMPLRNERSAASTRVPTPAVSSTIEPWADRVRHASDENAEAAAKALELLARRVRDGEISLAGYEPRLGDAAALAAALAALLGVRR